MYHVDASSFPRFPQAVPLSPLPPKRRRLNKPACWASRYNLSSTRTWELSPESQGIQTTDTDTEFTLFLEM